MHVTEAEYVETLQMLAQSKHSMVEQTGKSHSKWRYAILFLSLWILIPAFYCFDQPIALYDILKEEFGGENSLNFEIYFTLLYILYAAGNAFLPVFTGGMRDCNQDQHILLLVSGIMMCGQMLFYIGVVWKSFIFMILGRVVLGWGVESLLPLLACYISPYFRKDISIVLAILQLFAQFGLISAIYLTNKLYNQFGIHATLLSGVAILAIGLGLLLLAFEIDNRLEEQNYISSYRLANTSDIIFQEETLLNKKFYWFKFKDFKIYPKMFWYLLAYNSLCILNNKYLLVYCAIVTLVNVSMYLIASILFNTNNQFELIDIALFWMFGCMSLILIGPLVNYFGHRRYLLIGSVFIIMIGHVQFMTDPHIGLVILAIGYCLSFVCTWSSIIYIIKLSAFGKAFGITIGFQNLMFVFMPFLLDMMNKYVLGTFKMLFIICLLALGIAMQILIEDVHCCNILDNQIAPVKWAKHKSIDETGQDQDNFAQYLD